MGRGVVPNLDRENHGEASRVAVAVAVRWRGDIARLVTPRPSPKHTKHHHAIMVCVNRFAKAATGRGPWPWPLCFASPSLHHHHHTHPKQLPTPQPNHRATTTPQHKQPTMVGWSHCLALTLGLASSARAFVPSLPAGGMGVRPALTTDLATTPHPHHCACPTCTGATGRIGDVLVPPGARRRAETLVLMARGRRGRGGGGWQRRRRQDANPVEFDKYGFPIPPKKPAKELEEEHRKWLESIEPAEGFPEFDASKEGFTVEEMENDNLMDPAAAYAAAEAATAVAAAAQASGEGAPQEHEPDWDNIPEYAGEFLGMDDPLDAPWRRQGEELIRAAVVEAGFETYDVTWHLHHLNVDITRGEGEEGGEAGGEGGSLSSDEIVDVTRAIEEALFPHDRQLKILQRFHLCVGTPGAKDVLTTEREFQAFRGFEVHVLLKSPVNETQAQNVRVGRLMERGPMQTVLNVKGKNVTIPTGMIYEVRLPEAMHEIDDFEVMDEGWANLFVDGKVPGTVQVEYEMPGLVTLGKGVRMVEPEYYVPPAIPEEEGEEGLEGEEEFSLEEEE